MAAEEAKSCNLPPSHFSSLKLKQPFSAPTGNGHSSQLNDDISQSESEFGNHVSMKECPSEAASTATNAHNSTPGMHQDEPDLFDGDALIDFLESTSTKVDYQPVPTEINLFINRVCSKHNIDTPIWNQLPSNWKKICILGKGMSKEFYDDLKQAEKDFPGFQFAAEESGPLHTKQLCRSLLSVDQKRLIGKANRWQPVSTATCGLVLTNTEERRVPTLYAVTPAHLILDGGQCERLLQNENPVPIEKMREEVNAQVDNTEHILRVNEDTNANQINRVELKQPVMIAYRHYFKNVATPTADVESYQCVGGKCTDKAMPCPHTYMNDIAILQIEHHSVETLLNQLRAQRYESLHFADVAPILAQHIERLIGRKNVVFIRHSECTLVPRYKTAGDDPTRTYADHVAFTIGGQAIESDSGDILYIKSPTGNQALAMTVGRQTLCEETIYQAIMLKPALQDIEIDYRQRMVKLRPFRF